MIDQRSPTRDGAGSDQIALAVIGQKKEERQADQAIATKAVSTSELLHSTADVGTGLVSGR